MRVHAVPLVLFMIDRAPIGLKCQLNIILFRKLFVDISQI